MTASVTALNIDHISTTETRRIIYSLHGVGKTYRRSNLVALQPLDLVLPAGSFSSLIGPSGCGKTTLLKMMAGLLPPSSGTMMLDGSPVCGPRNQIGMMFQQPALFPWRTLIQNVLLPIEIKQGRAAAHTMRDTAERLIRLVGLAGFDNAYPNQLSGGMAQRAAICRMLITKPSMLLLDEPFSALDELARDTMNMELQRICTETGATALLVTHSIVEAVLLSDTVYVMGARPGRLIEAVPIALPRPRTLALTTTAKFGEYVTRVRSLLDAGASQ
ncbi:ABC transporter ATP-binding protein [Mesorhizobium sp. 1B3]|uniref:ABC transporter ATP-binding protein n=1 Tax=Mesorhizobium sp. 1B3 TaxID=3243599 RepID=UPI003D96BF96